MIKKIYNFLFPDDTKIKIECSTDAFWDAKKQKLTIHRKFYTLRSLVTFVWWYVTKNPYEKSKEILKELPSNPSYQFKFAYTFAIVLFTLIGDFKNISNLALIGGAIAFDATSSTTDNGSNPMTFSHTCTGSNLVLTVGVSTNTARTISSASYNSVAMTQGVEVNTTTNAYAKIYYLGSPSTGSNTVSISLSSSGSFNAAAISFSGANSASPLGITGTQTAAASDTISQSVTTSYENSFLVDCISTQDDSAHTYSADAGQTGRSWGDSAFWGGGGTSTKPTTTTGSYTMGWTKSAGATADNLVLGIIEIRELLASGPANLKSLDTNLKANIKSYNTNLIANIKSIDTNT